MLVNKIFNYSLINFSLTFDDRHRKHIHNQCDEQVHLHLVQCLALHDISERNESNEPHDTMTRPLEKLALTLKAANCIKVEQGRHKLLRQLDILLEQLLQRLWNDSPFALETGIGIYLKIEFVSK